MNYDIQHRKRQLWVDENIQQPILIYSTCRVLHQLFKKILATAIESTNKETVVRVTDALMCRLRARQKIDLTQVRVHDLKHTFGRRLRAAGVGFEDHQDLRGHRSGRITTHYSAAELSRLIDAVNSVCDRGQGKPELVVLRRLSIS